MIHKILARETTDEELTPFIILGYTLEEDSDQESDKSNASESTNE